MWKRINLWMTCIAIVVMSVCPALAVVDRTTLPVDINTDTYLSVGTNYHSDRGLDATMDDFYFNTDEAGVYSFHFHPMDRLSEVKISVKDRYYEKVFEDQKYGVENDLVYEYNLDGNETYYLRLYVLNGVFGEVHFDFKISPPTSNVNDYSDINDSTANYPDDSDSYNMDWIGDYVGDKYVVNCDEWVSLRLYPDTSSNRLAKVPFGAKVNDCYDAEFGFYYCEYEGTTGYIQKKYLSSDKPSRKYSPKSDTKTDSRYDLSQYEYLPVVEKGRGALVFQKSPRGSFMKKHKFYDGDYVYVNVNWRQNGYAIAYEDGEYGYVDASYIDW